MHPANGRDFTNWPSLPRFKGFWGYGTSSAKTIKPLGKLGCVCHLNFNWSVTDSNAHVFEHTTKTSPQGDLSLNRETNIWEDTYHIQFMRGVRSSAKHHLPITATPPFSELFSFVQKVLLLNMGFNEPVTKLHSSCQWLVQEWACDIMFGQWNMRRGLMVRFLERFPCS